MVAIDRMAAHDQVYNAAGLYTGFKLLDIKPADSGDTAVFQSEGFETPPQIIGNASVKRTSQQMKQICIHINDRASADPDDPLKTFFSFFFTRHLTGLSCRQCHGDIGDGGWTAVLYIASSKTGELSGRQI